MADGGKKGRRRPPTLGVEGNPGKTQITINEGDRQKEAKKTRVEKTS